MAKDNTEGTQIPTNIASCLLPNPNHKITDTKKDTKVAANIKKTKFLFFIILVTYSFLWTIPFYNAESFKFTLKKPFLSILKNF